MGKAKITTPDISEMRAAVDHVTTNADMLAIGSASHIARYRWGLERGLEDQGPHTYQEAAQRYGISRERVRQVVNRIERQALEYLKK